MPTPPTPNPDPDPEHRETAGILGLWLRKNAEFAARQEMERLIEEAKRQAGEPPQRDL